MVSGLTLHDIEGMQADIAAGKSARGRKGRGGRATGGAGVAGRTIGTLRGLLGHAARLKIVSGNPAEGVRQLAGERGQRRLNAEELRRLGKVLREAAAEGEHPTGLAAIRLLLLTGFGEWKPWPSSGDGSVRRSTAFASRIRKVAHSFG